MSEYLWPALTFAAWCFGFCAGIAWAAQFRPVRIEIHPQVVTIRDD